MSAPFSLPLRRSRALCAVVLVLHLLPLICGAFSGTPWRGMAVLCLVLLASAISSFIEFRRLAGMCLTLVPHGVSSLVRNGHSHEVIVLPASIDMGWLVVVAWRELATGKQGRAALSRDAIPEHEWRALKRFLRWELIEAS